MKVTRSQWVLVAAACLIVAASAAQSGPDRPPGADENNWAPISDSAGILLTNVAGISDFTGLPEAMRLQLQGSAPRLSARDGTGILMVKRGGVWIRVDLELPPARVQPLH
jgi:hypothetical protein